MLTTKEKPLYDEGQAVERFEKGAPTPSDIISQQDFFTGFALWLREKPQFEFERV